jgi:hypothetical protein
MGGSDHHAFAGPLYVAPAGSNSGGIFQNKDAFIYNVIMLVTIYFLPFLTLFPACT